MASSNALRELNDRHGVAGAAVFETGNGGLTRLRLTAGGAEAEVYLHGAHVTHYRPAGGAPVLFVSSRSSFAPGTPIRGGVPLIFPWFGPKADDPAAPMHGFVRTRAWDVESVRHDASRGAVTATFTTSTTNESRTLWPHDAVARFVVTLDAAALSMGLEVANTANAPVTFESALHTYFAVSDVRNVVLRGLQGADYLDKNQNMARVTDSADAIRPSGAMDRVYLDTTATCTIDDPGHNRRLAVEKSGSRSTVVWNPWAENMKNFKDLAADEWPRFLCVETANAKQNAVTLAPGASHTTAAIVRSEPL